MYLLDPVHGNMIPPMNVFVDCYSYITFIIIVQLLGTVLTIVLVLFVIVIVIMILWTS